MQCDSTADAHGIYTEGMMHEMWFTKSSSLRYAAQQRREAFDLTTGGHKQDLARLWRKKAAVLSLTLCLAVAQILTQV